MKRNFFLICFLPLTILTQSQPQIISYNISATIDDQKSEISGSAEILLRLIPEPLATISFYIPNSWTISSIKGGKSNIFETELSPSGRENFSLLRLNSIENLMENDTLRITMEFNATIDSSSKSTTFLNKEEFLLRFDDSLSWLPTLGSKMTERFSLEIKTSSPFSVFAEESFDTTFFKGSYVWKRSSTKPTALSSAFTLCGLMHAERQQSFNSDSLISISVIYSAKKFHQRYATEIAQQLNNAAQYFTSLTKQRGVSTFSLIFIGDPKLKLNTFKLNNMRIHNNSPAYSIFDSSVLVNSSKNFWLSNLAHQYCPSTSDSTVLFFDGFASYLSMRFLTSLNPSIELRERQTSISNALTFFPSGNLAEGITSKSNTLEVVSFKGRYIFLMLEYLLGKESFDDVIGFMSTRFSETQISFGEFQFLCEQKYGSSLAWFFDQWLYRASAPEFVMQWKYEKTQRGMFIVRTQIEQRGDLFTMPVPLVFSFGDRSITKRIVVGKIKQEFSFVFPSPPTAVELDPKFHILRWLLDIRISAHAKSSLQFLSINQDTLNAEREAMYTLQLDPNNSTGSAPLVYFVLGTISAARNDLEKAKEYFLKAMPASASMETEHYTLLSLIRYANILEIEGKRTEAVTLYQRAIDEGERNPVLFESVLIRAEQYLNEPYGVEKQSWFDH